MSRLYTIACSDSTARQVADIAREYGITEAEVVEQLVAIGLEQRGMVAR